MPLAFCFAILVSCLGCSGPIYRVGLPATETIAAIRDLKAVEDPSHWYAYYADEKTLRETSCSYLPSSGYKATIRGQKYCNFVTDDSIALDYSGSTKEGFMKVCLEKDPPINYFSSMTFCLLLREWRKKQMPSTAPLITPLAYINSM